MKNGMEFTRNISSTKEMQDMIISSIEATIETLNKTKVPSATISINYKLYELKILVTRTRGLKNEN